MRDVELKQGALRKQRRGRPPLPDAVRRGNRIVTFVTDRDMERLLAIAHERTLSISAVVHDLLTIQLHPEQRGQEAKNKETLR